ncbi:MAG: hypothetical protein WAW42_06010 [Candidatus Competibacteraceae bacterium]
MPNGICGAHPGRCRARDDLIRALGALGDTPQARDAIRKGGSKIRYLDYDWALNEIRR